MSTREPAPLVWVDGRVVDEHPRPRTPWQQILSIVLLLWLCDFALGLRATPIEPSELDAAQLRATLTRAHTHAQAGRRSILLIGDWDSQQLLESMRRELARSVQPSVALEQVGFDGLLPSDALRLVAELDRFDPGGEVELVLQIDLGFFAEQQAERDDCTHAATCALGPFTTTQGMRERLLDHTLVHRRQQSPPSLDRLAGLAVAREANAEPKPDHDAESRYRSAVIETEHAQLQALRALLDRASARQRTLTLFLTPLADGFVRRTFEPGALGRQYAALAGLINDHADPRIALLDLDHPLFVDEHFTDHVRLDDEGSRLLALNLLRELNLPLERRPFEQAIIHPEGHDRSLVHRVDSGYEEGGAWMARFDRPEGVAVSRDGATIVIADTHNHVLRQLRGNMQFVETVAGTPEQPGHADGRAALLDHPRAVELLGDAAWFIDGPQRERLRVLADHEVHTPRLHGTSCASYQALRAHADAIWALCSDNRVLRIDVAREHVELVSARAPAQLVSFDVSADAIYFADVDGRLWRRALDDGELGSWDNFFANDAESLLPHGHRVGYPYAYDELRLAKVVDLRFIERYGGLLVADEFPLAKDDALLTERTQLRYFDLDAERILPRIKPIPHGEAHALYNHRADQIVSYWHLGAMAIAQDDASLIWLEQHRSRLLRVADGLLGVAKSGNHHTRKITVPLLQTLAGISRTVESQLRPDRYLDRRHEPLARNGPYVAVLFGSSMSSMSDRLSNYSLGRRLELELQRELGYRELVRLDLFQVSWAAASFGQSVNNFANWMKASVPPDVIFIEAHDFGGGRWFMRDTKTRTEVVATFNQLRQLADRYDTLVVFYDLSSLEANRRDGMRSTDPETRELLEQAERLGFVVLDPGDRLLRELLRHSPWGNQPFAENQHHGATWAVDMTAHAFATMLSPTLREFFRDRIPARLRERPAGEFEQRRFEPLRLALDEVPLDASKLARVDPGYVQTDLVDTQLRVYVDLAGFGDKADAELDALAVAVIHTVLREDVYADFADRLRLELVEFGNYDEYGNGVLESAESKWSRELDRAGLEQFLREHP
ncbi:MAG TPA: hypothetical protein VM869_20990 [Enhygromyxa sp.]|nr:hypothetical protein [Enhygromyxa sp.]